MVSNIYSPPDHIGFCSIWIRLKMDDRLAISPCPKQWEIKHESVCGLCTDSRKYTNGVITLFHGSAREHLVRMIRNLVVGPEDNGSGSYHSCTMANQCTKLSVGTS